MLLRKSILSVAIFLLFSWGAVSQRYPFINYTPLDGLINNRVRSMYQDSKGRLYFLTAGGLSVYDGARFKNYTSAEGLAIDVVNDVLEITPDSFWIATNTNGFNCLVNGKVSVLKTSDGYYPVINNFLKTKDGSLYIAADDGLFVWDKTRFKSLPLSYQGKEAGKYLTQIKETGGFLILLVNPALGEDPGVILFYDLKQKKIIYKEEKLRTSHFTSSPTGDIWLTGNTGIHVLKKEKLQQGIFRVEDVPISFASIRNKNASFLKFDSQGQLWLSLYNEGLLLVKPGKEPVAFTEASGLASTHISYIFHDREGNSWFVPEGRGAQKLVNSNIELIEHPFGSTISDLYAQPQSDSVWIYSGGTGQLILTYGNTQKTFSMPFQLLSKGYVLAKGSTVYLYNEKYIYRVEVPRVGTTVKSTLLFKYSTRQLGYGILDPNGNLIYSSDFTLRVFLNNNFTFYYPSYFTDQLCFDQRGHLWIASRSGELFVLTTHPEDPANYLQLKYDLSDQMHIKNPRSVVMDDSGRIWIGTRYEGLYCFKYSGDQLTLLHHITMKDGLTDNFINYLVRNLNNTIWASSPAGLDKLSMIKDRLVIDNITQSNKFYVSIKKMMADKSGNIWAVGESGNLLKIFEAPENKHSFSPEFYISQIKAGQDNYAAVDSFRHFSSRQNNVHFLLAVPSFYDEKAIKYSYLLKGSSNHQWSEPSGNPDFYFVNLAPGEYTLNMKADFPAARYSSLFLNYSFTIDPAWWQTWWFRTLMGLVLVGIFVAMVRKYYRGKLVQQRVSLEKQQAVEKERTRIATDMHDDLGAGLSRIKYLSESIQFKKSNDPTIMGEVQKIADYSDEMVEKMGEIVWALNEKNDTLAHLVAFTRSYAADYLNTNNIQCIFQTSEEVPGSFVTGEVRRNVFLSVKESLHNVVKHAGAQTVTIGVSIDSRLRFTIHDDGVGIDWAHIRPFSNGLSNIVKRMEEIGGRAEIQNKDGTSIILDIPFKE